MKVLMRINVTIDFRKMSPSLIREWKETIRNLSKKSNVTVIGDF